MDPQKLLEGIMAEPDPNSDTVGFLANRLLDEYHKGFPLENLVPLLRSENERLLDTGIFIASELGEKGKPLLNDVSALLKHPAKKVRYLAIECVLLWAGPTNKLELASAVALLDDAEAAVRRNAMRFLTAASREQLEAALCHLEVTQPKSPHARGLQWLRSSDSSNAKEVMITLQSRDSIMRKYGAAAAARMAKS